MTKLCPRGKAAAKRKFRVYPSAYANAYASKICAGKIKDPSGVKRKDFRGRKPAFNGGSIDRDIPKKESSKTATKTKANQRRDLKNTRTNAMGGGLMEATAKLKRQGLLRGGVARGCGRILSNRKKVTKVF